MKFIVFTVFAFVAFSMTGYAADCTESDNPTQYTICQALETQCSTIISACNGNSICLSTVESSYDLFKSAYDLTGVTGCTCAEFTCDENFTSGENGDSSGVGSLIASAGLVGLMRIFA